MTFHREGMMELRLYEITDENRNAMFLLAMSMYLGERCAYCGRLYETLDDLKETVWYGPHEHGRLACESCWKANHGS